VARESDPKNVVSVVLTERDLTAIVNLHAFPALRTLSLAANRLTSFQVTGVFFFFCLFVWGFFGFFVCVFPAASNSLQRPSRL
jgi:hypothetical protein